MDIAKINKIQD